MYIFESLCCRHKTKNIINQLDFKTILKKRSKETRQRETKTDKQKTDTQDLKVT